MAITAQSSPGWIRSWDTSTSVGNSAAELEALLRRYGARGFTKSTDYGTGNAVLSFTLPRTWQVHTDALIEIRLTVHVSETLGRLQRMPQFKRKGGGELWQQQQAERVAWRHALLFVQASLEAAAAGIQTVEEAFFAHAVVPGTTRRMIDAVRDGRPQAIASRAGE